MSDQNPYILRYFTSHHLPERLQAVSKPFAALAQEVADTLPAGDERSTCLRKILEAKDCAVRAALHLPGEDR
ncbi:hypothetical protein [Streptomyces jumonjinensis]|uniref:Uncharacterized protein n=1 Tax=Streptomyces jumonjinensis TaxID=1945 RepID=A0A646KP17_STRJU|nr:hypothetical protein [Streptomyces jumonjinensis]MQT03850.1 hypothetical protein [Streptomyces jumonjinensis]